MRRVFSSESLAEVGHLRNLLEQSGIACVIRNDKLSGGLGEIPFIECLPELWIVEDGQLPAAQALIDEQQQPVDAAGWRCRRCGEANEGQFALCWSCGTGDERA